MNQALKKKVLKSLFKKEATTSVRYNKKIREALEARGSSIQDLLDEAIMREFNIELNVTTDRFDIEDLLEDVA